MLGAVENATKGFWKTLTTDPAVQTSLAQTAVSVGIAAVRYAIFKR